MFADRSPVLSFFRVAGNVIGFVGFVGKPARGQESKCQLGECGVGSELGTAINWLPEVFSLFICPPNN
jgi:hypothetical protein